MIIARFIIWCHTSIFLLFSLYLNFHHSRLSSLLDHFSFIFINWLFWFFFIFFLITVFLPFLFSLEIFHDYSSTYKLRWINNCAFLAAIMSKLLQLFSNCLISFLSPNSHLFVLLDIWILNTLFSFKLSQNFFKTSKKNVLSIFNFTFGQYVIKIFLRATWIFPITMLALFFVWDVIKIRARIITIGITTKLFFKHFLFLVDDGLKQMPRKCF